MSGISRNIIGSNPGWTVKVSTGLVGGVGGGRGEGDPTLCEFTRLRVLIKSRGFMLRLLIQLNKDKKDSL